MQHHTSGAIDKPQPFQPQPGQYTRGPGVAMGGIPQGNGGHAWPKPSGAADQGQFLLQRELLEQSLSASLMGGGAGAHPRTLWRWLERTSHW